MKKCTVIIALILSFVCITSAVINATVGCMAHSHHLVQKYDHKEYHFVSCNCPCLSQDRIARKNKCRRCGHAHDPRKIIIIGEDDNEASSVSNAVSARDTVSTFAHNETNPEKLVASMVKNYKFKK